MAATFKPISTQSASTKPSTVKKLDIPIPTIQKTTTVPTTTYQDNAIYDQINQAKVAALAPKTTTANTNPVTTTTNTTVPTVSTNTTPTTTTTNANTNKPLYADANKLLETHNRSKSEGENFTLGGSTQEINNVLSGKSHFEKEIQDWVKEDLKSGKTREFHGVNLVNGRQDRYNMLMAAAKGDTSTDNPAPTTEADPVPLAQALDNAITEATVNTNPVLPSTTSTLAPAASAAPKASALMTQDEYLNPRTQYNQQVAQNEYNAKVLALQQAAEKQTAALGLQQDTTSNEYTAAANKLQEAITAQLPQYQSARDQASFQAAQSRKAIAEQMAGQGLFNSGTNISAQTQNSVAGQNAINQQNQLQNQYLGSMGNRQSELEATKAAQLTDIARQRALIESQSAQSQQGLANAMAGQISATDLQAMIDYQNYGIDQGNINTQFSGTMRDGTRTLAGVASDEQLKQNALNEAYRNKTFDYGVGQDAISNNLNAAQLYGYGSGGERTLGGQQLDSSNAHWTDEFNANQVQQQFQNEFNLGQANVGIDQYNQNFTAQQEQQLLDNSYRDRTFGLQEGEVMGTYNGQQTLNARNTAAEQALQAGQLMGTYNGQDTLAAKNAALDNTYRYDALKQAQDQAAQENAYRYAALAKSGSSGGGYSVSELNYQDKKAAQQNTSQAMDYLNKWASGEAYDNGGQNLGRATRDGILDWINQNAGDLNSQGIDVESLYKWADGRFQWNPSPI